MMVMRIIIHIQCVLKFFLHLLKLIFFKLALSQQDVVVWAVAGDTGAIKLLDTASEACYLEIAAHLKPVRALAFSPTRPNWLLSTHADTHPHIRITIKLPYYADACSLKIAAHFISLPRARIGCEVRYSHIRTLTRPLRI